MMVAKELLSFPDARIYEVCEQVGYSNNSYFTLLFKNIHGQTPSEYRNSRNLKNTYT
jgi:two-component system response regulator YesN